MRRNIAASPARDGFEDKAAPMAERMLKFVDLEQRLPPKRPIGERRTDFAEIYREFEPARATDGSPVAVIIDYAFRFDLPDPAERAPFEIDTPAPLRISGEIRERGTRKRLPGVAVVAFRGTGDDVDGIEVVTDEKGVFRFFGLDDGTWKIYAEPDGYFPFRTTELLEGSDALDVTYYLERGRVNPYDVVVEASTPKKEVTRRTLTREELRKVAGTLGDPVLVVENLPGVARPALASGDIIVRGSGPQDTGVFIDGIQVPIIITSEDSEASCPRTSSTRSSSIPGTSRRATVASREAS
ncbi:MAG: hypothetical protein HC923_08380 [Myxococcales bacterium]|nr:hypothetical protein [Myxococcales bacterium]